MNPKAAGIELGLPWGTAVVFFFRGSHLREGVPPASPSSSSLR